MTIRPRLSILNLYETYNLDKERMMSRLTASDAREHFSEVLNRVAYGGDRVVVERRGKEMAAIVSLGDLKVLEAIEDRMDVDDALEAIEGAEKEGTTPWKTIKAELGL